MTLLDFLKLIQDDAFPLVKDKWGIDSRPQSVFEVTICFMSEEETWLTCNIQNEILVPWYDCEVHAVHPDDVHKDAICVWLKHTEYLMENFSQHIAIKGEQE